MATYTPIAVAYKRKTGKKVYVKVFTDLRSVDPIISSRSRKLPEGSEILDIGVGAVFESKYKQKYNLK